MVRFMAPKRTISLREARTGGRIKDFVRQNEKDTPGDIAARQGL